MADRQGDTASGPEGSFPTNAVVGIIEDPREMLSAAEDLRSAGLEPDVYCGDRGIERIESAGGSPEDVRITRMAQSLFGYEAEHTHRHTKALDEGNFLVLVPSDDDDTTDRIHEVFADHGGRFVNYYSRWTSRTLIP